jgi:cathepsin D
MSSFLTGEKADRQTIGVAMTYSAEMKVNQFPADGMLGMAFQSVSAYPGDSTLFETLVNEGKVKEPVFSIRLSRSGGELYLGGYNADMYTGVITYTDVTVVVSRNVEWTRTLQD